VEDLSPTLEWRMWNILLEACAIINQNIFVFNVITPRFCSLSIYFILGTCYFYIVSPMMSLLWDVHVKVHPTLITCHITLLESPFTIKQSIRGTPTITAAFFWMLCRLSSRFIHLSRVHTKLIVFLDKRKWPRMMGRFANVRSLEAVF